MVFFLVDDLGYMDIGANNPDTFYETPNIDQLSKSGMRFTDGYAANPVCSPTRYSILTGKYPTRVDATNFFTGTRPGKFRPAPLNNRMPLEETTLAESLKSSGYATFFAGKWHLGPSEEYWPEHQGFDVNQGGHNAGGPYSGKRYFSPFENPRLEDNTVGEHLPDRLAREASKFIEQHKDEPFLTYLSFYSVHTPLMAPPALVKKYKAKTERLGLTDKEAFGEEEKLWGKAEWEGRPVRHLQNHATYAAMVEAMDQAVGRVLKQIDDLGLTEETIVILTSDNGGLSTSEGWPTSNLPLRGGKGWVYEGGIREAFMIRAPGITKPGTTSGEPVCSIDFYPTILDLCGQSPPAEKIVDGVSLKPLLRGEPTLDRESLYWHYPHYSNQGGFPGGAIREGDWKLVERYEDGRVHLYNLQDDIGELNDVAEQNAERVAAMRDRLHRWYKEVDAKFLQPKDGQQPWHPFQD
ncbi:N-acetylgalactosamine 6-sulfate sulfatase (GALNS) [Rhodopirellula europaea SH398]|uniref:N-acetylgalactosamine 6-sulfate sulfatase (GALNS) n=1 Tax=Rhodopirellula europaea SH398 TaxID=1263868 RepID=M5SB65_9BACT|nr:N-acetylgalactosamine 6-sulfate sulfatase (GALNS) [Rhodopirellula europaea SH398]